MVHYSNRSEPWKWAGSIHVFLNYGLQPDRHIVFSRPNHNQTKLLQACVEPVRNQLNCPFNISR